MKNKLYDWAHKIPINIIVLAITFLNTFIVLLLTATMLLSRYDKSNEEMAMQNTQQTTENIAQSIGSLVDGKLENLNWIRENVQIMDMADDPAMQTMMELNSDIVIVGIYNQEGELLSYISNEESDLKEGDKIGNLSFLPKELEEVEEYYISPPHVNNMFQEYYPWVVTFMQKAEQNGETFYIVMDIQFSKISQYIDHIYIGDNGYIYIADEAGNMIYHPQQKLLYTKLKEERFDILPELYGKTTMATEDNIYSFCAVEQTKWRVVGVSNMDELVTRRTNEFIQFSCIVVVSALFLSFMLAMILFRGLTTPIERLIKSIQVFEKDVDEYVETNAGGIKEIRELQISFNHMAKRIRKLMDRIVAEETELRKFELKALQAQINPHFLYNTLDSIFWMCQESGNKEAANMVSALSNTFRISISRGKDEIFIKDELKHVESYLIIQNIRYKDQFSYGFDVESEILSYKCLKILLQPFVENAIYHGLNRMVDEGEILIKGYREEDTIIFQVIDNGVGMDEDQIKELYIADSDQTGIGVKNVHDRIQIFYGEEYGIFVKSELDEGTEITIKLPIIEEGESDV